MINVKYIESTKLSCQQEIVVSFRYKKEIVDVIRNIPERYWDANKKEWHLPYDSLSFLRENLPNEEFSIEGTPIDNKEFGKKNIVPFDLPKELKTTLYQHQKEAYDELMNYDKYLLLLQMGLGKTIVAISAALKRKEINKIKHCLIICGVNVLKYAWKNEIKLHTGMDVTILGNRKNKKGKWEVKSNKDKLEDLNNLKEFFCVTNVESLRDTAIKEKIKKLIDKKQIGMIVYDELQTCKTPSSIAGRAMLLLSSHVQYFIGMTGTIITNNPMDLYNPLKFVGREKATFNNYKYRYLEFGGWGNYSVVGYKHLDELQMKLDSVSFRRTKEQCLDLPPKIYIDEYIDMEPKQQKLYNNVLKSIMDDIDNVVLSPDPLSKMTRLRQVTDFPSIISSSIQESAKLKRLKEILETEAQTNKLLIFSNWTTVTDILYKELSLYNPAIITGNVKDRETEIEKFMETQDCRILIGTIGTMSTGLTLTAANTVIFFDEPWHQAARIQAEDRAYRIGTTRSVNIITLMCKNTIDEYIHKVIKKKGAIADAIVDKKYDVRNKDILQFLITGEWDIT